MVLEGSTTVGRKWDALRAIIIATNWVTYTCHHSHHESCFCLKLKIWQSFKIKKFEKLIVIPEQSDTFFISLLLSVLLRKIVTSFVLTLYVFENLKRSIFNL